MIIKGDKLRLFLDGQPLGKEVDLDLDRAFELLPLVGRSAASASWKATKDSGSVRVSLLIDYTAFNSFLSLANLAENKIAGEFGIGTGEAEAPEYSFSAFVSRYRLTAKTNAVARVEFNLTTTGTVALAGAEPPPPPPDPPVPPGASRFVANVVGDGSTMIFDIDHDMNQPYPVVQVREAGFNVDVGVQASTPNKVRVHFSTPPADGSLFVVIII